ncbi:Abi family protein [Chryseobacterium echinoideorum]|uniref:Abi family protein n=1 Tax=Chryseobacterium echinoideorum TaxID=1549648 RepID=UPI0011847C10|nr:Abi family protein [Chryseobacterium echinoideorum]
MGNIALSIDEQIDLLKSRGLCFEGFTTQKIKEILLDIGYYRLGFYWYDLRDGTGSHRFIEKTKFQTIIDLYYLDNDIRYILIKYLNRIEINFRTSLVYYVSVKYKDDSLWFVNDEVMENSFIKDFDNHYNEDFKLKHYVIKNHHRKYPSSKYAPAWKTLENFPFGSIFKIYQNIKNEEIKERISEKLGIKPIIKFNKTFKGLVHIRNRCAHAAILYNYYLPTSLPTIPSIMYKDDNRSNLGVIVKTISYVLNQISSNRKNDFEIEINDCLKKFQNCHEAFEIYSEKSGLIMFNTK